MTNFTKKKRAENENGTYFSAARKISDVMYDLNSGSVLSRNTSSSFTIPRILLALINANESSIARLQEKHICLTMQVPVTWIQTKKVKICTG